MRIIAGKYKGGSLNIPLNKNTRPLKDIVKENIFNMLTHSNKVFFEFEKSKILDLYSGSGSFGIECLSRNVDRVFFVENDKNAIKILRKNINKFNLNKKTKIIVDDVMNLVLKKQFFNEKFELIFCDPPFKDQSIVSVIALIFNRKIVKKNNIIIIHRHKKTIDEFPDYLEILDQRIYGNSKVIFCKLIF